MFIRVSTGPGFYFRSDLDIFFSVWSNSDQIFYIWSYPGPDKLHHFTIVQKVQEILLSCKYQYLNCTDHRRLQFRTDRDAYIFFCEIRTDSS